MPQSVSHKNTESSTIYNIYLFSIIIWISRNVPWSTSSEFAAAVYCSHWLLFKNDKAPVFSKLSSDFPNIVLFLFTLDFITEVCVILCYLNQHGWEFWFFQQEPDDLKMLHCVFFIQRGPEVFWCVFCCVFFLSSAQNNLYNTDFYFAMIQF